MTPTLRSRNDRSKRKTITFSFDLERINYREQVRQDISNLHADKKGIIDVTKNATGKSYGYLEDLIESDAPITFITNNHEHGVEKEQELKDIAKSRKRRKNDRVFDVYVYLKGLEKACTEFNTDDADINAERRKKSSIYRLVGLHTTEIHKKFDANYKECPFQLQWDKYNSLQIKKTIQSQFMFLYREGAGTVYEKVIFDEVDGLIGFRTKEGDGNLLTRQELEKLGLRFEEKDPEPITFNLDKNRKKFIIPLKRINEEWLREIQDKFDGLTEPLKELSAQEIQKHPDYQEIVKLSKQLDIANDRYLIFGKRNYKGSEEDVLIQPPMLTKILLNLTSRNHATFYDTDPEAIRRSTKLWPPSIREKKFEELYNKRGEVMIETLRDPAKTKGERIRDSLPTLIFATARMRDNFLMKYQLRLCFELAILMTEDNVEKEQLRDLWQRTVQYPEEPSPDDFPSPRRKYTDHVTTIKCYVVDPHTSLSDSQLSNSENSAEHRKRIYDIHKRYCEVLGIDKDEPLILATKKELANSLKRIYPINNPNWKQKKKWNEYKKNVGWPQDVDIRGFGGTSAGSNPESKYGHVYLYGDWINGEYSSLMQYLTFDGVPYNKFIKPKRYGYDLDPNTPPDVWEDIWRIIGLEFKEYILLSRYKRPVIAVNGQMSRNFEFFKKFLADFNIELEKLDI